ncbi:hypothetical protein [Rhizobacter sp. OV335]|uniref:hypothetical protein n=1 Tax=Rhizobacter sp. OV335 TaxID=1500264 RepID=UPI000923BC77|nr:hypothetical protein [Rhizobacter sp. OV335]SHL98328.1 hypothetical protein SAMN02787076_00237 [Rhizobacter sp. OV335]
MPDLLINFITLHPTTNPTHRAITHVGLMFSHVGSLMRQLNATTAIELIESDAQCLYFIDPVSCRRREVKVDRSSGRRPHLRARGQAGWTDDLLNLPLLVYPPHCDGAFPPSRLTLRAPCNERNIA